MMYTPEMAKAFRSITPPKGFSLEIFDNQDFITVRADAKQFFNLEDFDKRRAVEYMAKVKDALEQNGAIVVLVRDGGEGLGFGL